MSDAKSSGLGLGGVLFVVFTILKLIGVIGWSWWWITCPLWGPLAIILIIALVAFIIYATLK